MKQLKILLVNESGCFSPGITKLARVLSGKHRVCIVGPTRSGHSLGHKLTATKPLRAEQFFALSRVKIFGVNGTPCDCVALALDKLLKTKPDLIITGIDQKSGQTIYSSGTVSAAIMGTIHGIPSIAVAAPVSNERDEKCFAGIVNAFVKNLGTLYKNMVKDVTLNVVVPTSAWGKKLQCTHLTVDRIDNSYTYEVNPFGRAFYWQNVDKMGPPLSSLDQKGDLYWQKRNYTTVTPLKYDLTCEDGLKSLENSKFKL
ncbi:MAG: hypothetical protein FWE01_01805 [Firmicutes bacterium]|nr:hypothetical protein [Bacillota bacterium]